MDHEQRPPPYHPHHQPLRQRQFQKDPPADPLSEPETLEVWFVPNQPDNPEKPRLMAYVSLDLWLRISDGQPTIASPHDGRYEIRPRQADPPDQTL